MNAVTGIITGNIDRSTKRRYLSYSEGDFELHRWGEIWRQISPQLVQGWGYRIPKTFTKFRIQTSHRGISFRDFHEICEVWMLFQDPSTDGI